jgi:hypothetical protein
MTLITAINEAADHDEAIAAALYDAICGSNGAPLGHRALAYHLGKHGLVIVEASKWDSVKTALQVIGSFPITHPTENMDAASMATVAGNALKKMEL